MEWEEHAAQAEMLLNEAAQDLSMPQNVDALLQTQILAQMALAHAVLAEVTK